MTANYLQQKQDQLQQQMAEVVIKNQSVCNLIKTKF